MVTVLLRLLAFVAIALLIVSGAEAQEPWPLAGQWGVVEPSPFKNSIVVTEYSCTFGFAWVDSCTGSKVCAREMRAPR
jgi:hypothetical protein